MYHLDIMPVNESFDYSVISNYELLIFGFPCYHCNLPTLMEEFMEKMPSQSFKKKAFVFITYGLYAGNTLRKFIEKCKEKNIYVAGYADYRSPATDGSLMFPPFKFMYRYERKIAENILQDIEKVKMILSTEHFKYKLPRFKLYSILNYPNELSGKNFKPQIKVREDVCTNCHLCVSGCPRDSWSIGAHHPVFDKSKCVTCYKCIHHCPQEALVFSTKTIKKKRLNPSFYKEWKAGIISEIEKNG